MFDQKSSHLQDGVNSTFNCGGISTDMHEPLPRRPSTQSLKNSWKLKYQDFIPVKSGDNWNESEPFQTLAERANDWLLKNEEVHVKTCETITWMSHDQRHLGDGDQMILSKSITEKNINYYLRGLRLWLIPSSSSSLSSSSQSQKHHEMIMINYTDVIPEGNELISDLVNKINRKIKLRQFKGKIISVETVATPMRSSHHLTTDHLINGHHELQLTSTRWSEPVENDASYAFVLRVFTNKDTRSKLYGCDSYEFGIKDLIPLPNENGYESFETLIDKTNSWLKDQSDILIMNMQSLMVKRNDGPHSLMGSTCYYNMPGVNNSEPIEFFRILRVYYLRLTGNGVHDLPILYPFTYETFTPEVMHLPQKSDQSQSRQRLEKMKETFSKVIAFLRNSGADVICSETVMNPLEMYIEDDDDEEMNPTAAAAAAAVAHDDEIRFLFTIRLLLTGQIGQLTDGSSRLIKRASLQNLPLPPPPPPETSDLLPPSEKTDRAPLFLSNVVGRQFKYRWIILAVSAFSCMAIIVVVSVVYANK